MPHVTYCHLRIQYYHETIFSSDITLIVSSPGRVLQSTIKNTRLHSKTVIGYKMHHLKGIKTSKKSTYMMQHRSDYLSYLVKSMPFSYVVLTFAEISVKVINFHKLSLTKIFVSDFFLIFEVLTCLKYQFSTWIYLYIKCQ